MCGKTKTIANYYFSKEKLLICMKFVLKILFMNINNTCALVFFFDFNKFWIFYELKLEILILKKFLI